MEIVVKTLVYSSIGATTFLAIIFVLPALELRQLTPMASSLYFQVCGVVAFRELRIANADFEVYREEQLAT
ncbi:MAG: hypothetical protein CL477_04510 [Acidobacteria bacterium]|mgnify:CR=1 FL=1|jgi:hypothetical protein|nr:hypothetical protein [Acidobacteriota bacterium]HJN43199.1 hypothetical protein [Vicinamibacterales bacterium]|tara:strand:+ start:419 stop:631 length:213 start_codon:yes stop_codon:yes gene_type:complete